MCSCLTAQGCDGAHSTVRRSLSYTMLGDTTDTVWGVMDIYPCTTFPDIRRKCTIHTASAGNMLIIPREGGSLVRLYLQLPPGSSPKDVKLEDLVATAKRILAPYELEVKETKWWSAYSIGQRLVDHMHKGYRVFLTGDAAHTHSPKAGQGMNVSLQDGYNLGWKLASVLLGRAGPEILRTYVQERTQTARDLIAFDRAFAAKFSAKEEKEGDFADFFIKSGRYTAGFTARYEDSMLTDEKGSRSELAKGVRVGMRFPSAQVIRFCDCKALQLLSVLKSDGRWRIVVFVGDIATKKAVLERLATGLEAMVRKFTKVNEERGMYLDSVIEPLLVLSSRFLKVQQEDIPGFFWPKTGRWGIRGMFPFAAFPLAVFWIPAHSILFLASPGTY